jgi:hypothetical protein
VKRAVFAGKKKTDKERQEEAAMEKSVTQSVRQCEEVLQGLTYLRDKLYPAGGDAPDDCS